MICIIDCGTAWLEEIKENLAKLGYSCTVINLDEINEADFESFSGVLISGASTLLTQIDLEEYLQPFKFIKTADIPILGICLGHQIIGLLHGSEIHIGKMINKKENIAVIEQDGLFAGIKTNSLFQEEHSEFITLPKDFYLLAKSGTCDNEAMMHKNRKIYGVQFHPEVSGDNGEKVLKNFLNLCTIK